MRIRRMRLTLPARLKPVAAHEARRLAEAIAVDLAGQKPPAPVLHATVPGSGLSGHALAAAVLRALPRKGGA